MDTLREKLAEYAHEAWSGWMKYMFSKCKFKVSAHGNAKYIQIAMPFQLYERWKFQMNTTYKDLPDEMKPSDREEADRMIKIFKEEK